MTTLSNVMASTLKQFKKSSKSHDSEYPKAKFRLSIAFVSSLTS